MAAPKGKLEAGAEELLRLVTNLAKPWCYASTDWFCERLKVSHRQFYRYRKLLLDKGKIFIRNYTYFHLEKNRVHTHREMRPVLAGEVIEGSPFRQMRGAIRGAIKKTVAVVEKVAEVVVEKAEQALESGVSWFKPPPTKSEQNPYESLRYRPEERSADPLEAEGQAWLESIIPKMHELDHEESVRKWAREEARLRHRESSDRAEPRSIVPKNWIPQEA